MTTAKSNTAGPKSAAAAATDTKPAFAPVVKKVVTLPLFKWKNEEERYYKFTSAIVQGKELKLGANNAEGGKKVKKEPAYLANVIDLATAEVGQIIVGVVLRETLNEEYPENGYIDKGFAITQMRTSGKGYNTYKILEIEV